MPKLDLETIEQTNATGYPPPHDAEVQGRWYRRLAPAGGLTDFGVSHVVLKPGAWSSQRHWHDGEDEFLVVLSGEALLVEDGGATVLRAGDCAAFPQGHRGRASPSQRGGRGLRVRGRRWRRADRGRLQRYRHAVHRGWALHAQGRLTLRAAAGLGRSRQALMAAWSNPRAGEGTSPHWAAARPTSMGIRGSWTWLVTRIRSVTVKAAGLGSLSR